MRIKEPLRQGGVLVLCAQLGFATAGASKNFRCKEVVWPFVHIQGLQQQMHPMIKDLHLQ
jgi:hypothetical protein